MPWTRHTMNTIGHHWNTHWHLSQNTTNYYVHKSRNDPYKLQASTRQLPKSKSVNAVNAVINLPRIIFHGIRGTPTSELYQAIVIFYQENTYAMVVLRTKAYTMKTCTICFQITWWNVQQVPQELFIV
jgi:predicted alpha/beta-fold hydrolase